MAKITFDQSREALSAALSPLSSSETEEMVNYLLEIQQRTRSMGNRSRLPSVRRQIVFQAGVTHPEGAALVETIRTRVRKNISGGQTDNG